MDSGPLLHTPEGFADIGCQLPVWPVHQAATQLAALNDDGVAILPPSMPMHLLQPFTNHLLLNWDACMTSAMKEPCTAQRILELLHVAANSLVPEPAPYKDFVRKCAKAFNSEEDNDDKQARADVLYQSFQLPPTLRSTPRDVPSWTSSSSSHESIRKGLTMTTSTPYSPQARSEFEAVCWSRKGQTNPPPNATLCGTYQTLGRPDGLDGADVRDLTEILFLNVDDPESNDWTWHSASNLVIDLLDIGDMHGVKGFLRNYNGLLKGAGVKNEQLKQYRLQARRCIICAIASKICASLGTKVGWWPAIIITSGMKASPALESDEPIRVEHSRMCVREAIDWFYVGKLSDLLISNSNKEEETKRRLELGLDMLSLADKWETSSTHTGFSRRKATTATRLLEYCQRYEEDKRSIIDDCKHWDPEDDPEPAEESARPGRRFRTCRRDGERDSDYPIIWTLSEGGAPKGYGHATGRRQFRSENVVAKQGLTSNEQPQTPRRLKPRSENPRASDEQIVTDLRICLPAFIINEPYLMNPHWVEQIRRHAEGTVGLFLFFFFVYLQTLLPPLVDKLYCSYFFSTNLLSSVHTSICDKLFSAM
ncbi:hypothetical protein JOM56_004828 [Amanita muscaria]